jgi:hypothetical protein
MHFRNLPRHQDFHTFQPLILKKTVKSKNYSSNLQKFELANTHKLNIIL